MKVVHQPKRSVDVANCPECDRGIKLGRRPKRGQKFQCPQCSTIIEVVSVAPLEFDWAYDEDEESEGSLADVWSRKLESARFNSW
jgi:uncharacterized paraquat-inducible protein A